MITRRDLMAGATAATLTMAAVALAQTAPATALLESTAWDWPALPVRETAVGASRAVVRQPTRTLDELEMHVTTLKPRTSSHAPHTHPNEELVIVKEGTLQAHVNGREIVLGPGAILFFASMQPHAVQNVGDTPATYHVINWKSPGTLNKK